MQTALTAISQAARRHGNAWSAVAREPEELHRKVADGTLLFTLARETRVGAAPAPTSATWSSPPASRDSGRSTAN